MVIRKPPSTKKPTSQEPPITAPVKKPDPIVAPGSNLKNVKQFKDIIGDGGSPGPVAKKLSPPLFSGSGKTLGGPPSGPSRGGQPGSSRHSRLLDQFPPQEKKPRIEPVSNPPVVVDLSDDADDYIFEEIDLERIKKERQDTIKKEIMESFADDDMEEIVLIDDEYDDEAVDLVSLDDSLTDTSVIDELFNEQDALIEEFNLNNSKLKPTSEEDEIVSCPMCLKKIKRSEVKTHLERCYSEILGEDDMQEVKPEPAFDPNQPSTSKAGLRKADSKTSKKDTEYEQILKDCGYSDEVIAKALATMEQEEEHGEEDEAGSLRNVNRSGGGGGGGSSTLDEVDEIDLTAVGEECECPVCGRKVPFEEINQHLDGCLGC